MGEGRLSNRLYGLVPDNQLRQATGLGFERFAPARRVGPLTADEERYFSEMEGVGGVRQRSCILNRASNSRYLEVPDEFFGEECISPSLHVKVDQGSVGWQFYQWLFHSGKVRGSLEQDEHHRGPNDAKEATLATGLYSSMLLWTAVFNVFGGPWNNGHFHWYLKGFAEQFGGEAYLPIAQLLYEDMVSELKAEGPGVGTEEHLRCLHAQVAECPLIKRKGEKVVVDPLAPGISTYSSGFAI